MLHRWAVTTGGGYYFSPSIEALGQLIEEHRRPLLSEPFVSTSSVLLKEGAHPMSAVSSAEPKGAGVCKVQITVAVQGLRRNTSYPWRVWIRGNPVWKSNPLGDMISNQEGIAVGTATVNVLRVIEALDPDQTAGAIVKKLKEGRDASEVAYRDWVVEVITDKDPPLTRAPQSDEWVWPNAIAGKTFQIDMSITPP